MIGRGSLSHHRSFAMSATIELPASAAACPEVSQPLRLGAESNGLILSPAEFDSIEDRDEHFTYELIRGVVVVTPIPFEAEGDPNEELGRWLRNYKADDPRGGVLDRTLSERYVFLPDGSRRKANRLIWCGLGRLPKPKTDVAAIVAEFVSRRRRDWRRDYSEKRREYLAIGVREYWVIDRFRRTMTVSFLDGTERLVTERDIYETPLLPGFQLPLQRLLAIADEWDASGDE